jgi:hypothetical protein
VVRSPQLFWPLCNYWRLARPGRWLFAGRHDDGLVRAATLQDVRRSQRAALSKPVTVEHIYKKIRPLTATTYWRYHGPPQLLPDPDHL